MSDALPGRKLGRWMTVSLVVGTMIGSGIFLLPAALAPYGWNAVLGWGLTLGGALCVAAVLAWLARAMPREGGPYAFTTAAFGPLAGHMVAWSYWVSVWVGNAAIAVAGIAYLSVFVPSFATNPVLAAAATSVAIWALSANQLLGARQAGRTQFVLTVLKLIPLVAVMLIALGLVFGSGEAAGLAEARAPVSPALLAAAATLTLWSLLGFEAATVPAERIEDPERTIPFAILAGVAITGVIYIATCSAIVLLMPGEMLRESSAPFADFVSAYWHPAAGGAVAIFAAISCLGALNGLILVGGEMPFAMARGGTFPAWFGVVTARGVPRRGLIVSSALATLVVLLNYAQPLVALFTFIILLSTAATLFMYLACALAALKLSRAGALARWRGMPAVAAVAGLYALWAIYGAGGEAVLWGLVLLALGAPIYFVSKRVTTLKAGEEPA